MKEHSKYAPRPDVLGNNRLTNTVRDALVHANSTPLYQVEKLNETEIVLARVEDYLGKGHFGAALREADTLRIDDSALAEHYEFLRLEKTTRGSIGIADRYFIRGDKSNARRYFERALQPNTNNMSVIRVTQTAERVFDKLLDERKGLLKGLRDSIHKESFDQWCQKKRKLQDFTVVDAADIRQAIFTDYHLESVFGELPPIDPDPGYLDPLPAETEFIGFTASVPGAIFSSASPGEEAAAPEDNRLRASVAMPIVSNILVAKVGLFALDHGLSPNGQAASTVPLFRYEHLRDSAQQIISHIQSIESRMLPIQLELDNFAEVVDAIRRPLAEQEAELEAVKQKIHDLTEALVKLVQAEKAMAEAVVLLHNAQDECECDWWCWVVAVLSFAAAAAIVAVFAIAASAAAPVIGPAFFVALGLSVPVALFADMFVLTGINTITCNNVGQIGDAAERTLKGLRQTIDDVEAELNYALMRKDVLIANINGLNNKLSEVYESNAARVLDAKTLDLIQSQYNNLRQSLLTRAQSVAKLAQDAFNFERDANVHLIKESYFDSDRKDYTAVESLQRDLGGMDYIDLTGRTQKALQLTHVISLRKHYPMSYIAMQLTGCARITTTLAEFDRWFPGTYMQRIKEIKVEVMVQNQVVAARGYISNDGVSFIRFQDPGDKRKIDNVEVFVEPDPDIERLCYKRLQRRRHVDTMAFPDFDSYLYKDRRRKLQEKERNFFENVGPESSWILELLPEQVFEFTQISDVRIYFQYEAFFDENLKHILEKKRYQDRQESAALSISKALQSKGESTDFSDTVRIKITREMFEVPVVDKKIVNVGFLVKPKVDAALEGIARLEVSLENPAPIQVSTNEQGIVATAKNHTAGTGLAELEAMAHGKPVEGTWTVKIADLPNSISTDAIQDIFLLLNYEFVPAT
ncbi:hypothetical protein [Nitrosomonas communis]|uniref:Tc toxin complex TcA C-terminal TcB-binding domain-containing protein n=1 Tax=Nitrosomonas communis TaxID=44574 RepID=A0A1I4REP3_9PROT|nr:hypothetical protein [Nitrosomonas communis]SFM50699.1 hypothetical protein SAMN05421863_103232 [Nitrosomonas communis]